MTLVESGEILHAGSDRNEATRAFQDAAATHAWDSLDLSEIDGNARKSLTVRDDQSAVRLMMAEAAGRKYRSFRTLDEARQSPPAAVIIEGDYGGQIMATAPVAVVGCNEARLRLLAEELSTLAWWTNPLDSASVLFEPLTSGSGVAGGMGGGAVLDDVWVHEEFHQLGLTADIQAVIHGERDELPEAHPDVPESVRRGVVRAYRERVDVFAHVFGYASPPHLRTLHIDQWRARTAAYVGAPPAEHSRWYSSTFRAVARQAGLALPADPTEGY